MRQLYFVVSGPKFNYFFSSNVGGIAVDNVVSACRYLDLFEIYEYLRSHFKLQSCPKWRRVVRLQILRAQFFWT